MKYSIDTLLVGIAVTKAKDRQKAQERLEQNRAYLSNYRATCMQTAHHMVAVLKGEVERIERGYGSYARGITRDYWSRLAGANPLPKGIPYDSTLASLEEKIQETEELLAGDAPSDMEVLLSHAKSLGETTVSFSFLTRSGLKPAYINSIAVAGAQAGEAEASA